MELELYKLCPECGGEYRLEIERCADCGISLIFPGAAVAEDARFEEEDDEDV